MTREQVKQELGELKTIIILTHNRVQVNDTKGLQEKYEKAIAELPYEEQVIFVEKIYNQEPYWKIGSMVGYSEGGVRKKYSKIIDKFANMVEIKKTKFDRITENEETLAEFIVNNTSNCYHCFLGIDGKCEFALKYLGDEACLQSIKEWLQKECEND